jgi:hypothetical protein
MLTKHQKLRAHAAVGLSTQWFHRELSHSLSLAEFTERTLKEGQAALEWWLDAQDAGSATPEDEGLFLYLDSASDLKHTFPQLARGALVITIVALFEAFLARQAQVAGVLCSYADKANGLRGLRRKLEFLETYATVQLPKQSEYWHGMTVVEKLRNLLVHSEGRLSKDNPELRSLFKREGISVDENDLISLTPSSIEWVAETLGTLANEIDDAIRRSIGVP